METDRGRTRGKFTELVFDVKHDAWVIPQYSHGILLIVDAEENVGVPSVKVEIVNEEPEPEPKVTGLTVDPAAVSVAVGQQAAPVVKVTGQGAYDKGFVCFVDKGSIATVSDAGVITGVAEGSATVTYRSTGDSTKTATVAVTVTA